MTNSTSTENLLSSPQGRSDQPSKRVDLIAGLTVGVVSVLQGVAFSIIAHVPPIYGLCAMVLPTLIAALLGRSPVVVIGSTNTSALVIGALVIKIAPGNEQTRIQAMMLITFIMGMFQIGAASIKAGGMGRYVSQAVLIGFTIGAAALIGVGQIKNAIGLVPAQLGMANGNSILHELERLLPSLSLADPRALIVSALTILILFICRKMSRSIPGALISVGFCGALSFLFGWHAGPTALPSIANIPREFPSENFFSALNSNFFTWKQFQELIIPSFAIAILGMVEVISIGKALSAQRQENFYPNRELGAQGVSNILGSFFGCMPSSASWTRSALTAQLGARSRWAIVYAAGAALLTMLILAPYAQYIPKASLGALIIWIAIHMVKPQTAKDVWSWSKADATVMITTFGAMLFFEIQYAIYLGVFFSLLILVRRVGVLRLVEMVETDRDHYREVEIDEQTGAHPIVILQQEGDLFFGVVEQLEENLNKIALNGAQVILLRMKRTHAIDATAAETLITFAKNFKTMGGHLHLCGLKEDLFNQVKHSRLGEILGSECISKTGEVAFESVQQAIAQAQETVKAKGTWPGERRMIRQAGDEVCLPWHYDI